MLLEAALGAGWSHFDKFKEFCAAEACAPFTRDLWLQLGRFVALVTPPHPTTTTPYPGC